MRTIVGLAAGAGFVAVVALSACSSDDDAPGSGSGPAPNGAGAVGNPGVSGDGLAGDGDAFFEAEMGGAGNPPDPNIGDDLDEELEDEKSFQAPVATGKYLWSANPQSGRVALIDVKELSVRVLSAGLLPTYLTPVPGSEDAPSALVINVGSSDVTRFVVNKDGVDTDTIAVHTGANRWAMSEDWAVAYSAPEPGQKLDPTEGLQEITVIALGDKLKATRLAVGYRPSHLQISSDQKRLVVVSETDISVIQLGDKPKRADWVDLGFEAEKRDVSLSADGNFALVRRTDEQTVQIFDLRDPDQAVEVTFSGHVTDLDLSASGRGLAVIRSKDEIATFMLNDILEDPTNFDSLKIESELFGSAALTEDGKTAILYTTAVAHEFVNIVDLRPGDTYLAHRKLDTQSPVYSVTTAPDGKHAVILAATMDGGRGNAFSVVSLRNERFPRVVGAAATLSQVALANDFGIVTAASEQLGIYEAHVLNLPSLSVSSVDLSTKPLSAGVMAEFSVAYAAQQHPEGRVTFFDLAADQVRTLSGFELSAEVVDR